MAKLQIIFAVLVVLFATISFHKSISSFLLQKIDERENPRTLADAGNHFFPLTKNGQELHYKLKFIADLHTDSLLWTARNLTSSERGFVSLERLRQGNIAVQGFYSVSKVPLGHNIYSNSNNTIIDPISVLSLLQHYQSLSILDRNLYHARKLRDLTFTDKNFKIIRTRDDFEEFFIFRQNYFLRNRGGSVTNAPVAGILGIEGLHCLDNDVRNIGKLFDAGFRLIGITHFFDTTIAGSATGEEKYGLTSFGLEVVKEMEKLQLIADLAHTSPKTIDDFLKHTSLVPLVSHTGVKGTCNNSRNLADEHVKGIAAKGGVIGIGFWSEAVCGTTPKDVIKAIRYTADLVGVDHVALGSDWDGSIVAIISSEQISQITEGLILEKDENNERRFSDGDIEAIMGLNIKRFFSKHLPSL